MSFTIRVTFEHIQLENDGSGFVHLLETIDKLQGRALSAVDPDVLQRLNADQSLVIRDIEALLVEATTYALIPLRESLEIPPHEFLTEMETDSDI